MDPRAGDDLTPSLQSRLAIAEERRHPSEDANPAMGDPVELLRYLESSRRFHRDTGFGRIFHPGRVSFRENQPTDSLHIVVHHNHLTAHVDRVSPLGIRPERPSRYSLRRAAAHNLAGAAHDAVRLLRGRQGDHRCQLYCEWLSDSSQSVPDESDLLDPRMAAWSVQLEARVAGTLDEARLRAALGAALRRRPLTCDPLEVLDCHEDAALDAARVRLQSTVVRVNEWPPLRAALVRHPEGDVVMLNLNHAAADGFGALEVLASIARFYAGEAGEAREAGEDEPLDFLAVNDLPARPASAPVSVVMGRYRKATERLRDLLARPARLAPEGADDEPGYGFHLVGLSPQETRRVIDPERPGTSRNILMAGLHLAIGDWNLAHGTPGRRIGVLVPVNLRPPQWPKKSIGNFSVTARVSTSRRHRAGPASALRAVTSQTTRNKRTRTGIALIAALERANLVPLWAKQSLVVLQPLTRNRLVDTAMLSNLGWLERAPSFGPDAGETLDVWFSVPARAPLALCIGAVTLSGRLHLTFRYPHRLFDPDTVRRFADTYLARIRSVADDRPL